MTASFQTSALINNPEASTRPLKISELAEKFGISLRTLRFYEEKGLLKPGRKDGWARLYREDDIARLDFILNCRSIGLSVDETRHLLEIKDTQPGENFQRETTEAIRDRIAAIQTELETSVEQQRVAESWLTRLETEESRA
jgi:DNA-binding transcriptional MerR regulator